MRKISAEKIIEIIEQMFIDANYNLTDDVKRKIEKCTACEKNPLAKKILSKLSENLEASCELDVPICQDTGMAVVFIEIGKDVSIDGQMGLDELVNEGVKRAYINGFLRLSIVGDPLERINTSTNTPAVIYTEVVRGDRIKITISPKGFGSENMSALKMFTPSATVEDIIAFVCDTVRKAGSNPCPPVVVGVGIGGTSDKAAVLAKKALTRSLDSENSDPKYAELEKRMLDEINKLNIGPQGFGGDTTALKVNIEKFATHIAGLPVAVNINCHVCRHGEVIL